MVPLERLLPVTAGEDRSDLLQMDETDVDISFTEGAKKRKIRVLEIKTSDTEAKHMDLLFIKKEKKIRQENSV